MKVLLNSFHLNDRTPGLKSIPDSVSFFSFRIVAQKLQVNSAFPGLTIQCSTDGGQSWSDVKDGMTVSGRLVLGTR